MLQRQTDCLTLGFFRTFIDWFIPFTWNANQLTAWPVKTAVRPACLRDLMDFMWEARQRSLSGGFRWLNEVTTESKKKQQHL